MVVAQGLPAPAVRHHATRRPQRWRVAAPCVAVLIVLAAVHRVDAQETAASKPPEELPIAIIVVDLPVEQLFPVEPIGLPDVPAVAIDVEQLMPQGAAQKPPPTQHTGFGALVRGVASDYATFPRRKSTYVILAIGGAAAALAHPVDDNVAEGVVDKDGLRKAFVLGKYLGATYTLSAVAVGTYVYGRYFHKVAEGQSNKISHMGFDMIRGIILTEGLTQAIKIAVRRDRPNGQCCSFPSGHASVTFAIASILERHFGYRAAWPTFVIGGYVAASRLFDSKHFVSDVLFGSALGIASGWTVVGRHGRNEFAMIPTPRRGGMGVTFVWTPGASRAESVRGF